MIYKFDAIKNNIHLLLFSLIPPYTFIILLIISYTNGLTPYLPQFFVKSLMLPIIVPIAIAVLIIWNKKRLFWTKMEVHVDQVSLMLNINNTYYNFSDLEYYEYKPGSMLTTGGRAVLFIKFKAEKKIMIMPCKSSPGIKQYDLFKTDFNHLVNSLTLNKKKKILSNVGRTTLIIICVLIPVVFIGLWVDKGPEASLKLFPSLVFLGVICGLYLRESKN